MTILMAPMISAIRKVCEWLNLLNKRESSTKWGISQYLILVSFWGILAAAAHYIYLLAGCEHVGELFPSTQKDENKSLP